MELGTYLEATGESQAAFAVRAGTTPATISRLVGGKLKPSLGLAVEIERVSDGKVPTAIWVAASSQQEAA